MQRLTATAYKAIHQLATVTGIRRLPLGRGRTVGQVLGPILKPMVNLGRSDRPIMVRGHRMHLPRQCDLAAWILTDDFEQGTTELFERSLHEGMTVVDGGAYVGYHTLLAARHVGRSGRVYAFEPQSENFALLVKNVELNGYSNVIPVRKALGGRSGTAMLHLDGTAQHSLYPRISSSDGSEAVEVVTLDEFLEYERWPHVDLVKLDLEGGEPAAIEGMHRLLARSHRLSVVLEFAPDRLQRAQVDAAGFLRHLHSLFDVTVIDDRRGLPLDATRVLSALQRENAHVNLLCQQSNGRKPA